MPKHYKEESRRTEREEKWSHLAKPNITCCLLIWHHDPLGKTPKVILSYIKYFTVCLNMNAHAHSGGTQNKHVFSKWTTNQNNSGVCHILINNMTVFLRMAIHSKILTCTFHFILWAERRKKKERKKWKNKPNQPINKNTHKQTLEKSNK